MVEQRNTDSMGYTLEASVEAARTGDIAALETVITGIQDRIYGLAMRMLAHPQDAQDATQEILVKIVTNLNTFRHEASFLIWACRIAVNHLLTMRKRRSELHALSFEQISEFLEAGLASPVAVPASVDQRLLVEEVKIGCTQGMLLCLDREHRVAYILGEIFEVSSREGADILDITPEAFRQRLSRARKLLRSFLETTCGIINPANACRCDKQVGPSMKAGLLNPDRLVFVRHPTRISVIHPEHRPNEVQELETLDRVAALYRSHPNYAAPGTFVRAMKDLLTSRSFTILNTDEKRE
jgi:RNA polymerase sigma factor (sigma-70 family)